MKMSLYGGSRPEQPIQSYIAFEIFLQPSEQNLSEKNATRSLQILDTSIMTLASEDATFDGCHFCLPRPMDHWSRMLYHRLLTMT